MRRRTSHPRHGALAVAAAIVFSPAIVLAQDADDEPPALLVELAETGRQIDHATRLTSTRCPNRGRALRASFAPLLRRGRARLARFNREPPSGEARYAALRELFELLDRADALRVRASDCGESEALHAAVTASSARDTLAEGGLVAGQERDIALASTVAGEGPSPAWRRQVFGDSVQPNSDVEMIMAPTEPPGFEAQLAAPLRASLPALRQCAARAQRLTPTLGGEAALRFTVGVNGRVNDAALTWEGEASRDLGACIVGVTRWLLFASPREPVVVHATLRFSAHLR